MEKFAKNVAGRVGFELPWEMIIELLYYLIDKCFPEQGKFVECCQSPTLFQVIMFRWEARRFLRQKGFDGHIMRAGNALANEVFTQASSMSEDELVAAFKQARGN